MVEGLKHDVSDLHENADLFAEVGVNATTVDRRDLGD